MMPFVLAFAGLVDAAPVAGRGIEPYETAVRLVDRLYLERDRVDEVALLHAAARGIEEDVHWLRVDASGRHVELRHGNGTVLGTVEVVDIADLPRALEALERLVARGGELDGVNVRRSLLAGMADALDRYSRLLADDRLDRFNVRLTGTLVGIGATFAYQGQALVVASVHPRGPAAEAGLQPGDEVVRIDGRSTVSMPVSEAVRLVRGDEGTQVVLQTRRGVSSERRALTRARVVVPNVTHRVLQGDVGYVHIDHISQRTVDNLRDALRDLRSKEALDQGLVIDLRGNTGGSMKEAARLADLFLGEGLLLRTAGRDGGRVHNLEREMRATASEHDLDVPVVIVVNPRTASGSEILAGALLEHHRAGIVGTSTYGKGTVQKSYPLEDDVHLKLTVARYILANERQITPAGLPPDVHVGRIRLDGAGVHFEGWTRLLRSPTWGDLVPEVVESSGWRGRDAGSDVALELARRAVASAEGPHRETVVAQLEHHAAVMRMEQQAQLESALADRGIDWSPAPEEGTFLDARVDLTSEPMGDGAFRLMAVVHNDGQAPMYRGLVHVTSRSMPYLNELVLPVGKVAPGSSASGELVVHLPAGIAQRLDEVHVVLRADRSPPLRAGSERIVSESRAKPRFHVEAKLVDRRGPRGPHGHPIQDAEVVVTNLTDVPVPGLEVHFGYPEGRHVELLDRAARTPVLPAHGSVALSLGMEVFPSAPLVLPMELVIESERGRPLAEWTLSLPTTGDPVTLEAPGVTAQLPGLAASVGDVQLPITVTDDHEVDHVVVWANGEKVAWMAGGSSRIFLRPTVRLLPGDNRLVVEAQDDQGVRAHHAWSLWGDVLGPELDAVDASDVED